MGWQETSKVIERMKFVLEYKSGRWTMTELCERFGISRPTGYSTIRKYEAEGPEGLRDHSRKPHSCPHQTKEETRKRILELKEEQPLFGAKKIRRVLKEEGCEPLPAKSTIHALLERNGLVKHRKKTRHKSEHPGKPYVETEAPNDVWAADFKGEFKTLDGVYCYPLTIMDLHTRFILKVKALPGTKTQPVISNFLDAFRRFGLPKCILTDNGVPFATTGFMGFSQLNVWWLTLGITHLRTEPSSPAQNGILERMHRELKAATTRPPAKNMQAQQRVFYDYRHNYNVRRPHEAIDDFPAKLYVPSERQLPSPIPKPVYPQHFETRLVSGNGSVRFRGPVVYFSQAMRGLELGFEDIGDGIWNVYFYERLLGRLDERTLKLNTYTTVSTMYPVSV